MSRRNWLVLGGLVAVAAGAGAYAASGDTAVPDRARVRTDTAPLQSRFTQLGQLSAPHWLGWNPNDSGREPVPDQDPQIRVVGIARLPAGRASDITGPPEYAFSPTPPAAVPKALAEFLRAQARWLHSARFDQHVTRSHYRGRFHFDPATDSVWFDTVAPQYVPGVDVA